MSSWYVYADFRVPLHKCFTPWLVPCLVRCLVPCLVPYLVPCLVPCPTCIISCIPMDHVEHTPCFTAHMASEHAKARWPHVAYRKLHGMSAPDMYIMRVPDAHTCQPGSACFQTRSGLDPNPETSHQSRDHLIKCRDKFDGRVKVRGRVRGVLTWWPTVYKAT